MTEAEMNEKFQQLNDTIELLIQQRTSAVANAHNETVKFAVELKAMQRKIAALETDVGTFVAAKDEPELPLSNGHSKEERPVA